MDVQWVAPPQCPDESDVAARVADFLQGSNAPREAVVARVEVTRTGSHWVATLELTVGEDTEIREVRDPECELVATATAFVIAVAVDPDLPLEDVPDPDPEPPPPEAEAPAPPAEPAPAPEASPSPELLPNAPAEETERGRPRGLVQLGGALDVASLAQTAVGPRVTGGLQWGRWRIELPLTVLPAPPVGVGSGTLRTVLWLAELRGCVALGTETLEVPLCLGVEAGRFDASGRGFEDASVARAAWVAPTVAATPTWWFRPPFGLRVGLGAVFPLHRPRFDVEGHGLAHRASVAAFRAELGFAARFP